MPCGVVTYGSLLDIMNYYRFTRARSSVTLVFFLIFGPSLVHARPLGLSVRLWNLIFGLINVACIRFWGSRCVSTIIEKTSVTRRLLIVYGVCTIVRPYLVRVINESCMRFEPKTWLKNENYTLHLFASLIWTEFEQCASASVSFYADRAPRII